MPFGLVYGGIFFLLFSVLFCIRMLGSLTGYSPPAAAPGFFLSDLFMALMLAGIGLGLFLRQRWARWAGGAVGVFLAFLGGWLIFNLGTPDTYLILFGSCLAVALLAIPVTGDVSKGLPEGKRGHSRFGCILGYVVAGSLVGFMASYAMVNVRYTRGDVPGMAAGSPAGSVQWQEYGPGLEKASGEDKPVLIDFFAEWCGPCKEMDRRTFRDPRVVASLEKLVPIRVDAEGSDKVYGFRGEDLADNYNIMTYPTFVLLDPEGREISRISGFRQPKPFLDWVDSALQHAGYGQAAQ